MRQLRVRAGFPPTLSLFTKPFVFRGGEPPNGAFEWKNIEQLEAVVESYVNYRTPAGAAVRIGDPWAPGATPLDSSNANYERVNLGVLEGDDARILAGPGNVIQLDDDADLSDVIVNPAAAANPFIAAAAAAPNMPRPRQFLFDTLWLKDDTRRATKLYRIMAVDNQTKQVTLDATDALPTFSGTSDWRIYRRPIIILIDPLGPRRITGTAAPFTTTVWEGTRATIDPPDPTQPTWTILRLNPPPAPAAGPPLDRFNPGVDTIYLPDDSAAPVHPRPARTYRIMRVGPVANTIAVDGTPNLPAAGSAWHVPAGLSGVTPYLEHGLNPAGAGGWDHYDGLLLVVHKGQVQEIYRFTSYTSRRQAGQNLSSLRGNSRYAYGSYRSPAPTPADVPGARFRNYNFQIIDAAPSRNGLSYNLPADAIAEARFYFATRIPPGSVDPIPNVTRDANGKGQVRFHRGNRTATGTGSAGCNVSPDFVLMRHLLVKLYEADFREFYGVPQANVDSQVHKLNLSVGAVAQQDLNDATSSRRHADVAIVNGQNTASEALWNAAPPPPAANPGLAAADWDGKLRGITWVIRPDEPPLS